MKKRRKFSPRKLWEEAQERELLERTQAQRERTLERERGQAKFKTYHMPNAQRIYRMLELIRKENQLPDSREVREIAEAIIHRNRERRPAKVGLV